MTRHTPHATRHTLDRHTPHATRLIALILATCASCCVMAADIPTPRILVEHETAGFMGDISNVGVTFVDCVFDNNHTYDAEMTQTRSVDLINCDLRAGFSGTVGLRIDNIGVAYYGVHLLGGRLRNRLNLATSAGAGSVTYGAGVSHSVVRTEYDPNLPTAQSASFLYNIAGDGSGTNVAEGNGS